MSEIGTAALALATVAAGVTAGVFFLYSNALMPGLRRVDDRTFVAVFQAVDRAIINPLFLGACFLGTLVLTAAAALTHLDEGRSLGWIVAAGALHVAVMVITIAVHVPRNDALKAAGDPDAIDAGVARAAFGEGSWTRWNHLRVVLALATAVCLSVALAV